MHPSIALAATMFCGLLFASSSQQGSPKPPVWSHAFDLKCRKTTQPKFDKDTSSWGVEVFRDDNNGKGIYVTESGNLAAVPDKSLLTGKAKSRSPEWLHGLDLKVRPVGVDDFAKALVFGLEVFRDENNTNWIYISEVGAFSVTTGARSAKAPTESPKAPKLMYWLGLIVRPAGEKSWDKEVKKWGIEVFLDENTGNLIYMCEKGTLAIVPVSPEAIAPPPKAKSPTWLHGLDLRVRKGGDKDFDPSTKKYGVEAFLDENNGNLIYICETGDLAVVPGKQALKTPTAKATDPLFTHGLDLKCRRIGQKDFTKDTPNYGVEVFNDNNTGCTIYIGETGAITAIPK